MTHSTETPPGLRVGQSLHFVGLAILLALTWLAWTFLGQPLQAVFWISVAFPVMHQVFVWVAWRLELQSFAISKTIGFQGYLVTFFLLFIGRFVSLVTVAWLDRDSLNLAFVPQAVITAIFALLGIYALYSVRRYFGMARAAGADHFEQRYRNLPLIKDGIFRFTDNGMYLYAFFLFWSIAVGFNSAGAIIIAAFSHAYIWIHFYATEKPDMNFLYGLKL